jgi:PGF-CTERM protein
LLVTLAVFGVALAPATAASHFQITSEDSQPVPEDSVEFRNTTYQLNSVILADPGDEINVSVRGPDDAYRVYVYNSDEQLVDSRAAIGNDTFTFDLAEYEQGSYAITVYQAGDYEAFEPLVVEEYDVNVDTSERTGTDRNLSIDIGVEQSGIDEDPAAVKAVVSSGERDVVVNATGSDGEYTATVEAGALEAGNYTVYGVVQGEKQVFSRSEILGVSDPVSLSVRNATMTPTAETDETTVSTSEPTPTPTLTATAARTETSPTATPMAGEPTETAAAETQASAAEESAITPNVETQPETTSGSGPGFSVVGTVVALALAVALRGRWD